MWIKKSTVSVDAVLYDEEGKAVYAEKYKFTAYPNKEAKDIKVRFYWCKSAENCCFIWL